MHKARIPFKDITHEVQLTARRSLVAFFIIVVLVSLLLLRLAYLQVYKNLLYTTLSTNNWMDLVPLEPTRGLIYDRHGVLLAENIPVFSLDIIPDKVQNVSKTLSEVNKIIPLTDGDLTFFHKQLKQHRRFEEIPVKLRLTDEEVTRFVENQYHFPGVVIKARLIRHYPLNDTFSHVLGYIGQINTDELNKIDTANYSASRYIGKLGIEKFYEDELHGTVGYEEVEINANGEPVRVLKHTKPEPGRNLYLSIDSGLQKIAEQALAEHRGALVAIEPETGQVLALVSTPTYDPNLFVLGISPDEFHKLQELPDHPLYNRAVRGLYPIASTIKPYIALEALDTNVISEDYTIFDPGWFMLKNSEHVFRDWKFHGHGTVDLSKAISSSCDTYFFELSLKLGIKHIDEVLHRFGFGEVSGIEMDEEVAGVVASPEWKRLVKKTHWYEGDTLNSGIGQGYMQATPVQLAAAIATLANRGKHFAPSLVLGQQDPNKPYEHQSPVLVDTITLHDNANWDIIIDAMQKVVDSPEGSAHRFGPHPGYTVAAKTGTAQVHAKGKDVEGAENQKLLPERWRDNSLFIAFAPVEQPKIALAIIVENDKLAAVPIAKQILDYYLGGNHDNARPPAAQ